MVDQSVVSGIAVVALIALTTALGLWLRSRNGRQRAVRSDAPSLAELLPDLDARRSPSEPTVVQVSAAVCSPCRATARVWRQVLPESEHVELDVEEHVALAERLGVWRTPTSFVFGADGHLLTRVDGVPTAAQARAALSSAPSILQESR